MVSIRWFKPWYIKSLPKQTARVCLILGNFKISNNELKPDVYLAPAGGPQTLTHATMLVVQTLSNKSPVLHQSRSLISLGFAVKAILYPVRV
jgi:hypothetical protein